MLGLLVALAYFPVLRTAFFSDDYVLLWQARASRFDLSIFQVDPAWFFYRPLGKLVWLIMYRLWGVFPAPYHALSIGLHWLNGLLLIALVRRLMPHSGLIAPIAGSLFLLLPLQVEAVVWAACYYDLLATCFYLLTLWSLLMAWQQRSIRFYLLSLGMFQLGLWSKELAFTLPLMVVVLGGSLVKRPKLRVIAASTLPYLGLVALNLLQRYLTWGSFGGYPATNTNVLPRVWNIFATTLATMIAPLNQMLFPAAYVQIWLLAMTVLLLAGLMAGYNQRLIVLACAWIVVTLLPVLNILPIGTDLQNSRLLYLPSAGFCIGIAAMLDALARRIRQRFAIAAGVAVIALAYLTSIAVQVQPWLRAGHETIHTVQELHRLIPYLSSSTTLQAQGVPDTYKGAFIYRLGLPEAYDLLYGSRFALQQVAQIQPLADQRTDKLFQVVFGFDDASQRWEIIQARGVTVPPQAEPVLPPSVLRWDFTSCQDRDGWQTAQQQLDCQPGRGLSLQAAETSSLESPPLNLARAGWTEVIVRVEHTTDERQSLRLEWTTARDQTWSEARSLALELLPDNQRYDYHFFVPPDSAGAALERLRLSQSDAGNVSIANIVVRPIE
jgi:hypothetical protein